MKASKYIIHIYIYLYIMVSSLFNVIDIAALLERTKRDGLHAVVIIA